MAGERTVNDIVGACQEQTPATEQELRLALLCLYYGWSTHSMAPRAAEGSLLHLYQKEAFEARFRVMKAEPSKYLGERYTPGTEANQQGRKTSMAILAAATKGKPDGR
jgi:hypothetical protein